MIHWEQKKHKRGVTDDTWLNEALSEISPVYSGYGTDYTRVYTFEKAPSNSLTLWDSTVNDYGVAYMWSQYLMDRFGTKDPNFFWNIVNSSTAGIDAVNSALSQIDSSTFASTFQDWSIALYSGNALSWDQHPEWSYTSVDTRSVTKDNILLPGLFPLSKQNVASLPALSEWSVNFYSFTPTSSTTGTATWSAASSSVHAALADASPSMHADLVSSQAYTYSVRGFLVLNNPSGTNGAAGGTVTNASFVDGSTQPEADILPAVISSPKAMLEHASSDPATAALAEMTSEPQPVCIHTYIEEKERAARAKGRIPFR